MLRGNTQVAFVKKLLACLDMRSLAWDAATGSGSRQLLLSGATPSGAARQERRRQPGTTHAPPPAHHSLPKGARGTPDRLITSFRRAPRWRKGSWQTRGRAPPPRPRSAASPSRQQSPPPVRRRCVGGGGGGGMWGTCVGPCSGGSVQHGVADRPRGQSAQAEGAASPPTCSARLAPGMGSAPLHIVQLIAI